MQISGICLFIFSKRDIPV